MSTSVLDDAQASRALIGRRAHAMVSGSTLITCRLEEAKEMEFLARKLAAVRVVLCLLSFFYLFFIPIPHSFTYFGRSPPARCFVAVSHSFRAYRDRRSNCIFASEIREHHDTFARHNGTRFTKLHSRPAHRCPYFPHHLHTLRPLRRAQASFSPAVSAPWIRLRRRPRQV